MIGTLQATQAAIIGLISAILAPMIAAFIAAIAATNAAYAAPLVALSALISAHVAAIICDISAAPFANGATNQPHVVLIAASSPLTASIILAHRTITSHIHTLGPLAALICKPIAYDQLQ